MSIEKLANALKKEKALVFTGAGVSTNSGIPDFRSETGFYQKYHEEDLAIEAFFRDPDKFYIAFQEKFSSVFHAKANDTHKILGQLEKEGYISTIITQNVDQLHQAAGSSVIEFHGNIFKYDLIQILNPKYLHYKTINYDIPYEHITTNDQIQYRVSDHLIYKPQVVLFGEGITKYEESAKLARSHNLHIIMGTSYLVSPFNMISYENTNPDLKVFVINKEPINYYNTCDYTEIIGDTSEILLQLQKLLNDR